MKIEEKVNLLNELLEIEEKNDIGNLTSTDRREFQQWVEDLGQGLILDKIRAEIEEYKSRQLALAIGVKDLEKGKQIALEYVLAIIDKYKEGEE